MHNAHTCAYTRVPNAHTHTRASMHMHTVRRQVFDRVRHHYSPCMLGETNQIHTFTFTCMLGETNQIHTYTCTCMLGETNQIHAFTFTSILGETNQIHTFAFTSMFGDKSNTLAYPRPAGLRWSSTTARAP
jgi:hypothetical protein